MTTGLQNLRSPFRTVMKSPGSRPCLVAGSRVDFAHRFE
jgi:hypothetical protein